MAEKVFVTGGSGRIGTRLVTALVAAGGQVTALARSDEAARTLQGLGATVVRGDILDVQAMKPAIHAAQRVYHLAGGLRGTDEWTCEQLNHRGTQAVLEACKGHRELGSLVFTSSVSVYGDRKGAVVDENKVPLPDTDYGRSKVRAEAVLLRLAREEKMPYIAVRVGTVYGPGFPVMMEDAIREGRAVYPGDGRNHMSTIHVDDVVAGLRFLSEKGEGFEIYNLCDHEAPQAQDFYEYVARATGGSAPRYLGRILPRAPQHAAARVLEQVQIAAGRRPRATPDHFRLLEGSVRMSVQKVADLGFSWSWPTAEAGVAASVGVPA